MNSIYLFFIAFTLIFISELGDKTQLLVLSFSTKNKVKNILLGVALGTFFSHGLAIIFGSKIASFNNDIVNSYLRIFTYTSFILFGIIGFIPKKNLDSLNRPCKFSFLSRFCSIKLNYIFVIALSIAIGEIGDKTFLASLGMSLQYPNCKLSLIFGSICGMVASNSIAILFGKLLNSKLQSGVIEFISNFVFVIFGVLGLVFN